jgi:hypothetical protein
MIDLGQTPKFVPIIHHCAKLARDAVSGTEEAIVCARKFLANGLAAAAFLLLLSSTPLAWDGRDTMNYRTAGPRLGPYIRGPWDRGWCCGAYDLRLVDAYPIANAWYPWGYTAPFVRVGRLCVSNELVASVGGEYVRYQRVYPRRYCR